MPYRVLLIALSLAASPAPAVAQHIYVGAATPAPAGADAYFTVPTTQDLALLLGVSPAQQPKVASYVQALGSNIGSTPRSVADGHAARLAAYHGLYDALEPNQKLRFDALARSLPLLQETAQP